MQRLWDHKRCLSEGRSEAGVWLSISQRVWEKRKYHAVSTASPHGGYTMQKQYLTPAFKKWYFHSICMKREKNETICHISNENKHIAYPAHNCSVQTQKICSLDLWYDCLKTTLVSPQDSQFIYILKKIKRRLWKTDVKEWHWQRGRNLKLRFPHNCSGNCCCGFKELIRYLEICDKVVSWHGEMTNP